MNGRSVGLSSRAIREVGVVVAVVVAGGWLVAEGISAPDLDRVEIEGDVVVARAADNEQLWSASRPLERPVAVVEDFVGDSRSEVAIGWSPAAENADPDVGVVMELRSDRGEVLRSFDSSVLADTAFPRGRSHLVPPRDDDGQRPRRRRRSGVGPDQLPLVFDDDRRHQLSQPDGEAGVSLRQLGPLPAPAAADLNGDGMDEIVAVVINNPMGFQRVLVTFGAKSRLTGESCLGMASPDIEAFSQARTVSPRGMLDATRRSARAFAWWMRRGSPRAESK